MQKTILNNELSIEYPDTFTVLTTEEMQKAFGNVWDDRFTIRNTELHILFSVFWKKTGGLFGAIADAKSVAKATEAKLKGKMPGYTPKGRCSSNVCGNKAEGFRYEYSAGDVRQACEVLVFKYRKCFYTVYYYKRTDGGAECDDAFGAFLSSFSFK